MIGDIGVCSSCKFEFEIQPPVDRHVLIAGSRELTKYVFSGEHTSRVQINLYMAVGLFFCGGILIVWIFVNLGKSALGWGYLFLLAISVAARVAGSFVAEEGQPLPDWAFLASFLPILVYVAGWIHANAIWSRYGAHADQRIKQIDETVQPTTDLLLEKALLLWKVLGDKGSAETTVKDAMKPLPGNPILLRCVGQLISDEAVDRLLSAAGNAAPLELTSR